MGTLLVRSSSQGPRPLGISCLLSPGPGTCSSSQKTEGPCSYGSAGPSGSRWEPNCESLS